MKQTRLLTILLISLLVVSCTYLASDYTRQQKRQASFADQIENTERALAILPTPAADLEKQLAEISAAGVTASQNLSDNSLNTTTLIDSLLGLADKFGLTVTPLTAQAWADKKAGQSQYKVLPLDLQIQGSLQNLIDFIKQVGDSQKYPNLLITGVQIENTPAATQAMQPVTDSISVDLSAAIVRRLSSSP